MTVQRRQSRLKKKASIRKKISGTSVSPRISVFKSLKYLYVQAIDDDTGSTICSFSSLDKHLTDVQGSTKKNLQVAEAVGKKMGDLLSAKGIQKAVFDRNGYKYHGKIKSLADGIRSVGINF